MGSDAFVMGPGEEEVVESATIESSFSSGILKGEREAFAGLPDELAMGGEQSVRDNAAPDHDVTSL